MQAWGSLEHKLVPGYIETPKDPAPQAQQSGAKQFGRKTGNDEADNDGKGEVSKTRDEDQKVR